MNSSNLLVTMKLLIFAVCILAVDQYGQASFPVKVQAIAVPSEQCASQSTAATILESLEKNFSGIIENNIPTFPSNTCECSSHDCSWTRVAYLNMTDSSQTCPSAWVTINTPVRACGRQPSNNGSCDSVFYSTNRLSYTQVCGRMNGYQYGNPNAFSSFLLEGTGLNSWYVDGVSLTHGPPGSRTHVWTFANAWFEISTSEFDSGCPCMFSNSSEWPYTVPSFVGNNYFCATGSLLRQAGIFYADNPLWDGVGCTGNNTCCQFNQPPWFCRTLPTATSDDLEVRICANQGTGNENTYISNIELYVR